MPPSDVEPLRTAVVDAVLSTPYVNDHVDRTRVSILYRYASFQQAAVGYFAPTQHLQDEHLVSYWLIGCADLAPRSRDKVLSELRTVATQCAFVDGVLMRRVPTSAPYTDEEWGEFRRAADRLTDPGWRLGAHTLLDLSGESGLRGSEINAATGTDLHVVDHRITIHVRSGRLERVRTVPIAPSTAERLADRVGDPGHLLRPHYRNRKNVVSSLVTSLTTRDSTFDGFRAARARHRWIGTLLDAPIAMADVMYLAGLESDSHTLYDIWAYLPDTEPARAIESYEDVRRHLTMTEPGSRETSGSPLRADMVHRLSLHGPDPADSNPTNEADRR